MKLPSWRPPKWLWQLVFWACIVALGYALVYLLVNVHARAHDGFELVQSPKGGGCCNLDCGPVELRTRADGQLQALVLPGNAPEWTEPTIPHQGIWVDVDKQIMLKPEQNPIAGPALCYRPVARIPLCAFPGREG